MILVLSMAGNIHSLSQKPVLALQLFREFKSQHWELMHDRQVPALRFSLLLPTCVMVSTKSDTKLDEENDP